MIADTPTPADTHSIDDLTELVRGRTVAVLTGAGCSTESGIPDYRGPDGRMRVRAPVQYGEFVGRVEYRHRYWSRSAVGWPRFTAARPNAAHHALARLEDAGHVVGIITQNVDGLHAAAGSRRVVELHGSLARVCCLDCGGTVSRMDLQETLESLNADWIERARTAADGPSRPDGDVELGDGVPVEFHIPDCTECGGVLKPDVVFFGESVPRAQVDDAWALLGDAEVLLVAGSSLTVYSGRRFVYGAEKAGQPIAIVNRGPTRGDAQAAIRVDGRLGEILPALCDALLS